jgi:hypothetical protein
VKDNEITITRKIGYWYLMEHGTYIRAYDATKAPNLLPRFIPDKLVFQEVSNQTMIHGVRVVHYCDKKYIWPLLYDVVIDVKGLMSMG